MSASSWQFHALAQSAWSRGKPSQSRHWYQRWKRATWLKHLCGAMCEASPAAHGVARWTASLAASRASRTALPAGSAEASTNAICGARPGGSSCNPAPGSSSSKTSAACSRRGLTKSLAPSGYGETFGSLVSRLRSDCSERAKSARRTNASACSSSAWLTPDVPNGGRVLAEGTSPTGKRPDGSKAQVGLSNEVANWPTPSTRDHHAQGATHNKAAKSSSLATVVEKEMSANWPTPTANDWKGSGPTIERQDGKMRGDRLDYATEQLWSTPRATDGEKGGPNQAFGNRSHQPLAAQSAQWPTPTSLSIGESHQPGNSKSYNETMRLASSLPAPAISTDGAPSSKPRRVLNPLFVACLMGWPLPASTGYGFSETALSRFKPRMRFALSQLDWQRAAPPAQPDLFA